MFILLICFIQSLTRHCNYRFEAVRHGKCQNRLEPLQPIDIHQLLEFRAVCLRVIYLVVVTDSILRTKRKITQTTTNSFMTLKINPYELNISICCKVLHYG